MKISHKAKIAIYLGITCSVSYFAVYLARNILSPVTNSLLSEGFTEATVGLISSTYLICYACGQLINGFIGYKVPAKYMITVGLLVAGTMNLLFPLLSFSIALSVITYSIMGFALSMIYSPMVKTVAENVEPLYAPRCTLGFTFSSLLASPGASFLAAILTWRSVYYTTSTVLIVMGVLTLAVFLSLEKRGVIKPLQVQPKQKQKFSPKFLTKRGIIKFILVAAITGVIRTSVVFWLPTYFAQQLGFSAAAAAKINTISVFIISLSAFAAVFAYERLRRNLSLSLLLSFMLSAISFAFVGIIKAPIANAALITLAVFTCQCADCLMWAVYCPSLRDTGMTTVAVGVLDFTSYVAAALGNIIFGNAVAKIGWSPLILVWFILMCIGIAIALPWEKIFMRKTKNNDSGKIFVFDMDGTLIDSMPYYLKGVLSILDDEGYPHDNDLANKVTVLGYTGSAKLFSEMGISGTVSEIYSRIESKLLPDYANEITLKAGVAEYLEKIKNAGGRMFILTGSPHSAVDACLKKNGVHDYFEQIWSVEDFGLSKSDTSLYAKVAELIGAEPNEISFFDDNKLAIETARKSGYFTYGVVDRQSPDDLAAVKETAAVVVNSFTDLL